MAGFTDRVLRHRWLVIAAWVLVAAVGGALAPTAIDRLSYDFGLPGQPAYETNQDVRERFGNGGQADPLVVTVTPPPGRTLDEPAVRGELGTAFGRLQQPGWRVVSPLDTGYEQPYVSADRRTDHARRADARARGGVRAGQLVVPGPAPPHAGVYLTGAAHRTGPAVADGGAVP